MTTEQNQPWAQDNHVFFWNKIQLAQHLKFYDLIIPKASTHVTFGQQSSLPRQAVLAPFNKTQFIACVASVSMWFQSKEQGMRVNPSLPLSPRKKWHSFHFSRGQNRKSHSPSFLCLSLLQNHMEMLATQATKLHETTTGDIHPAVQPCYVN